MGMSNAMAGVRSGELSGFYNPAVVPFAVGRTASIGTSFMSLDRHLNSLFYSQPIDTNAGIAVGILNSGVSNIDGRDADGFHTENYSTSENLFMLSFGLKIRKITIGITPKLYYSSLFSKFSAKTLGFDFGILYPFNRHLSFGLVIKDVRAEYKWDSSVLYDVQGNTTNEKFLLRKILGASYLLDDLGLVSAEIETNSLTTIVRLGAEALLLESLTVRAGIDGWDLHDSQRAHPSFGISFDTGYTTYSPVINYAFVVEPYGLFAEHVLSLSVKL